MRAQLSQGLAELGLVLTEAQQVKLLDYLALIQKWNKVYNLTAVRDKTEMLTHHLLDSLAVIRPLQKQTQGLAKKLLDVGSGAGLPGIVIAICCPEISVTCIDAVAKKSTFIQQAAISLKLPNLQGLHARIESLAEPYDIIGSRAFASLVDFTSWSSKALISQGLWFAMKGKYPADEIEALVQSAPEIDVFHVEQLSVPGLDAERCILWLRRKAH